MLLHGGLTTHRCDSLLGKLCEGHEVKGLRFHAAFADIGFQPALEDGVLGVKRVVH